MLLTIYYPRLLYILPLTTNGLASPTPDLAVMILQLVIFVELTHGIADMADGRGIGFQSFWYCPIVFYSRDYNKYRILHFPSP